MRNSYKKPLKVSRPNGERIVAIVHQLGNGKTFIQLPFIKEVQKDGTFEKGKIQAVAKDKIGYINAIEKIEQYLESLFLKELGNDNLHTSHGAKNKSGRNIGSIVGVDKGKVGGDRSVESIHSGSRRSDSSESDRLRGGKNKLAKDNNSESKGSGKDRD